MCIRDRKLSRAVGWWSEPLPGSADVADRQRIGKNQSSQQKAGCSSLTSSWSQEGSQGIDIMSIVSSQTLSPPKGLKILHVGSCCLDLRRNFSRYPRRPHRFIILEKITGGCFAVSLIFLDPNQKLVHLCVGE